jgi:serine/threonine-protein kinase
MEYVEGGGLADLFRAVVGAGELFPIDIAVRIMVDALEGLGAAHTTRGPDGAPLELVHRDVSPQNLLVGIDGTTRVTDFGIAKAAARATITEGQQVKGKLAYMAPEQAQSSGLTAKTDLWAAAAVLWELVTGARLFQGDSRSDTMQKVLFLPIPSPRKHRPEVSAELEAVLLRGLARSPDERYESATAFAEALEAVGPLASHREVGAYVNAHLDGRLRARRAMHGVDTGAASVIKAPSDAVSRIERTGRGRRRTFVAAVAIAIVLGVGLGLAVWKLGLEGERPTASPNVVESEAPRVVEPPLDDNDDEAAEEPASLEGEGEPAAAEEAAPPPTEPTMRRTRRRLTRRGMMRQGEFRPDTI